jgi:hypothetical protein
MSKSLTNHLLIALLIALGCSISVNAQKTKVSGKIYDAATNEPLPFVNLSFQGSKIGITSDINGFYSLETYYATDSLSASFVGYKPKSFRVKKDKTQVINFPMQPGQVLLQEVVIKYDRRKDLNPAHEIFKNVSKNKKANNREKLDAYEYEVYNKVEFDVNNIDEKYKNKRAFKPFQFIFEHIDTTDEKPYLPMFITEAIGDFYYRKNPKSHREEIKASRVSGVKNESVQQFLGDMYQNVNIYDNYITVFGKSFISPVADFGLLTYHYYLTDSAFLNNKWCYKLDFNPKRKHELTFVGEMWISDTTYAVKQITAKVSENANINFINDFSVYQEYNEVENEVWMMTRDELIVDFIVSKKAVGFYGRKTSTYRDFIINKPRNDTFFKGMEDIIVSNSAGKKPEEYWTEARHVKLTKQEAEIYAMIDTLTEVPAFKSYVDILQLLVTGYKVWGKLEFGPYFNTYSFNQIEGHRFRLGLRTSNAFSTRLMLNAYLAYGTQDRNFKYGGGFKYFLSKNPRQSIDGSYKYDVEQLGISENAWSQDNIISSVFRRTPFDKLSGYEEFKVSYEREWFQGFSHKLGFMQKTIRPLGALKFNYNLNGVNTPIENIQVSEVNIFMRFAYKEKFVSGEFERMSLGTKYPTIQLQYAYGIPNFLSSAYEYHKVKLNVKDKIRIGAVGMLDAMIEGGKIWGALPFPLLQLHNGNETYAYDISAFNLMNYYEFVSDEYATVSLTHHFNGFFLNKIPIMNELKWREVVSVKAVTGKLNDKSYDYMNFPLTLSDLEKPYYEAGIGIENIFQLLRIDFLWRMAYVNKDYIANYESLSSSKIAKWGIRGMLQFNF